MYNPQQQQKPNNQNRQKTKLSIQWPDWISTEKEERFLTPLGLANRDADEVEEEKRRC